MTTAVRAAAWSLDAMTGYQSLFQREPGWSRPFWGGRR
jgi:hypothetical protein